MGGFGGGGCATLLVMVVGKKVDVFLEEWENGECASWTRKGKEK